MSPIELLRGQPQVRAALVVPSIIVLLFGFFTLSSVTDPSAAVRHMTVAVVDLDAGASLPQRPPVAFGAQFAAGLAQRLPSPVRAMPTEDAARAALDRGEVSAVVVFPAQFSAAIVSGETITMRVLVSDHLSVAEAQFGRALAAQVQGAVTAAAAAVRRTLAELPPSPPTPMDNAAGNVAAPPPAAPSPPSVAVEVAAETLYAAAGMRALQAPFVLGSATWMGCLVGAILLFAGTRRVLRRETMITVALVRTAVPLAAALLAGLVAALIAGALAGGWDVFWWFWLHRWFASFATATVLLALFCWLGWFGIAVAVPLVFYQGMASGLMIPVAAAPDWIAWIGAVLPLEAMSAGLRTLLIGGPDGSIPWAAMLWLWAVAVVAVWAGTAATTWFRRA